jgi:hypothetical protein
MPKIAKTPAVIDIPDVKGAFVGTTLRPLTRDEFRKIKMLLAKKKTHRGKIRITNRDLRAAGLEYLTTESTNGKPRQ